MQQTNDVLFNLLDSHDTKRLRSDVKNLDEYFQQLAVLFTMPGSPCIYYGTEIAMEGGHDPDCRRCMPWEEIDGGVYMSGWISSEASCICAGRNRFLGTVIFIFRTRSTVQE